MLVTWGTILVSYQQRRNNDKAVVEQKDCRPIPITINRSNAIKNVNLNGWQLCCDCCQGKMWQLSRKKEELWQPLPLAVFACVLYLQWEVWPVSRSKVEMIKRFLCSNEIRMSLLLIKPWHLSWNVLALGQWRKLRKGPQSTTLFPLSN